MAPKKRNRIKKNKATREESSNQPVLVEAVPIEATEDRQANANEERVILTVNNSNSKIGGIRQGNLTTHAARNRISPRKDETANSNNEDEPTSISSSSDLGLKKRSIHRKENENAVMTTETKQTEKGKEKTSYPEPHSVDRKEIARLVREAASDPATLIVRRLAVFRCIVFLLLVQAYVRHLPLEVDHPSVETWFTYDQFEFFHTISPKKGSGRGYFLSLSILGLAVFFGMLAALGGINTLEHSYPFSAYTFLGLYGYRFFIYAHNYSDRHYLLWLLGILCAVSGGGSFFLLFTEAGPHMPSHMQTFLKQKRSALIQQSRWGAITLRFQFAVVIFYTALWKLNTTFLQGIVIREHLLGLDEKYLNDPSSFWFRLEAKFGNYFFPFMGMCSCLMDISMFLVITLRRPTLKTNRQFVMWSFIYYGVQTIILSKKLGYSFTVSGLCSTMIFHPICEGRKALLEDKKEQARARISKQLRVPLYDAEADLVTWILRYLKGNPEARATRPQRLFSLVWLILQILLPMRMPVISHGSYPYTALGQRFSWTFEVNTIQSDFFETGKMQANRLPRYLPNSLYPFYLSYLVPVCPNGKRIQRKDYMKYYAVDTEDPRSLPVSSILPDHLSKFIRHFPRYMARVAGGMSRLMVELGGTDSVCGGRMHAGIFGVHFVKLNSVGAFSRIMDPTINLMAADIMRLRRSWRDTLWGVLLDRAPVGYEYLLKEGIGTMNPKIESYRAHIHRRIPGITKVEFVADRAACLVERPLSLWPNGHSMLVIALEAPLNATLFMRRRGFHESVPALAENQWDGLESSIEENLILNYYNHSVTAVSVELGLNYNSAAERENGCGNTKSEDVLLALIFRSY